MIDYVNYEVEKIIYESNFQRILLCKNESGDIFYNNIVLRNRLIELIDKEYYPNNSDNIIAVEATEDRLYIFTEYTDKIKLTEYLKEKSISYKSRVELTERLLIKLKEVERYSDIQAECMMTEDNILIDSDENIEFKNVLIFNQDYDIEESKIMKNISNYIHYIFAGEFIKDFHISEEIPPDIGRIIKRANTNEYNNIDELLESLKKSPTYSLILPMGLKVSTDEVEKSEAVDENDNTEGLVESDKKFKKNKKYIIPIIIAIIFIPIIILLLTNNDGNIENNNSNGNNSNPVVANEQNENTENEAIENNEEVLPETINEFFNEEIIKSESDKHAEMDYSKFYDGYYSLKTEKDNVDEEKFLFTIVDLNSEDYEYLKNREIGISSRFTSDKNIEGEMVIELRKNGEIFNITTVKLELIPETWVIKQKSLSLGESDEIKLFFRYKDQGNVWIDSIEIDVLK